MTTAFQFTEVTEALLFSVNVRTEFHGEEHVPAMDLSMRKEGSNELLNLLEPGLREALYFNSAAKQGQETLPEVLAVLPNLRFPKLNKCTHSWAKGEKHKGYRLILDYGLGDELSNVDLDNCTVTNWRFEVKEGGTVVLEWVVQYAGENLTSDVRGKLTGLIGESIHIQLIAPATPQITRGKDKGTAITADADDDETPDLLDGESPEPGSPEAAFIAEANGGNVWAFPGEAEARGAA